MHIRRYKMANQFPTVIVDMILSFLPEYEFIDEIQDLMKREDTKISNIHLALNPALPKKVSVELGDKVYSGVRMKHPYVNYGKTSFQHTSNADCNYANKRISHNIAKDYYERRIIHTCFPYDDEKEHFFKERLERNKKRVLINACHVYTCHIQKVIVKLCKHDYGKICNPQNKTVNHLLSGSPHATDLIKDHYKLYFTRIVNQASTRNPELIKCYVAFQLTACDDTIFTLAENPAILKKLSRPEEINDLLLDLRF